MEMQLNPVEGNDYQFTSYSDSFVELNNKDRYESNTLVVTNKSIFIYDELKSIHAISIDSLQKPLIIKPDLVIIAQKKLNDLNSNLMQDFLRQNIGVELMSVQALCRTFNFLVSEERRVLAIICFN